MRRAGPAEKPKSPNSRAPGNLPVKLPGKLHGDLHGDLPVKLPGKLPGKLKAKHRAIAPPRQSLRQSRSQSPRQSPKTVPQDSPFAPHSTVTVTSASLPGITSTSASAFFLSLVPTTTYLPAGIISGLPAEMPPMRSRVPSRFFSAL